MKQIKVLALICLGLSMASCNLDNDVNEQSFNCTVSQLVIPDNPQLEVSYRHNCQYTLNIDMNSGNLNVSAPTMSVLGMTGAFSTDPIKYAYSFNGQAESYTFAKGTGRLALHTDVTDVHGFLTTLVTYGNTTPSFILGYHANGATVKSFYPQSIFSGTTKTSYSMGPGNDKSYESTQPTYLISFSEDMKKADVVIYNVKFAEEMKKTLEAVILKDLTVTLGREGYEISGNDIIPDVKEGSGTTPYVNYPFKNVTIKTVDKDLTQINCDYVVSMTMGGVSQDFHGEFTGWYADYIRAN